MVKYARLIFEEEIPDGTSAKDALDILLKSVKKSPFYLTEEDVETSDYPYERVE